MKETTETVERYGHKYEILHTIDKNGLHQIMVARDGILTPLQVWGKPEQYPQITVGGLHVCELLTTWSQLNPDSFLCWAN